MTIYEAHIGMKRADYANEADARAAIEAAGDGYYVEFVVDFDGRARSCAMHVFGKDGWERVNIFR